MISTAMVKHRNQKKKKLPQKSGQELKIGHWGTRLNGLFLTVYSARTGTNSRTPYQG